MNANSWIETAVHPIIKDACNVQCCNILLIFQTLFFLQERGLLLLRVRTELKQTLMAYQVFLFALIFIAID